MAPFSHGFLISIVNHRLTSEHPIQLQRAILGCGRTKLPTSYIYPDGAHALKVSAVKIAKRFMMAALPNSILSAWRGVYPHILFMPARLPPTIKRPLAALGERNKAMRINYPAEFRLEVNRLEAEFLQSPQGKGRLLQSASRQDGSMMFADYPAEEFVIFLEARGVPVVHID
jgi:hypothetical protein